MRNKIIAAGRQNYEGRWYNRGDEIETLTEQDAEDLVALNHAEWADKGTKETKKYKRRDMRSEH